MDPPDRSDPVLPHGSHQSSSDSILSHGSDQQFRSCLVPWIRPTGLYNYKILSCPIHPSSDDSHPATLVWCTPHACTLGQTTTRFGRAFIKTDMKRKTSPSASKQTSPTLFMFETSETCRFRPPGPGVFQPHETRRLPRAITSVLYAYTQSQSL